MDCDKYEPLLIDELYDELDEVTSAAVKRHVAGCAKCAAILNGMKSTRREAVLPVVALPAGLEDRILAAAKEAQKVVPIQSRFGHALSLAGRWAMRPQTAMAAVFLLMIGSSAFLIRAKKDVARPAAMSVTEQGAPEPQVAATATDTVALSSPAAASAHGPSGNANTPNMGNMNWAAPPPPAAAPPAELAARDIGADKDMPAAKPKSDLSGALSLADDEKSEKKKEVAARSANGDPSNAGVLAGAGPAQAPVAATAAAQAQGYGGGKGDGADGFSQGMASYRARNFADATRQFDGAARTGDLNSALWAAKSVKDGNGGCVAALPRFESVAQRSGGTWIGNEASLEAARCQIAMGRLDAARDRLNQLAQVPSHAQQAQQAIGELNQVAARSGGAGAGGAAAARKAAPAPAKAPASPKAIDGAGF